MRKGERKAMGVDWLQGGNREVEEVFGMERKPKVSEEREREGRKVDRTWIGSLER